MAEILATAGFAVALPGVAVSFCQCGKYLYDRFSAFQNAPESMLELKEFFRDLYEGTLKTHLELAEWAFTVDDLDPSLKSSIENLLQKLLVELQTANRALNQLFYPDGSLRKRTKFYEFFGLNPARTAMQNLRRWQDLFQGTISLVAMKKQVVPDDMLLTSSKFQPIVGADNQDSSRLAPDSHLWLGTGEVRSGAGSIREISFVMERMDAREYAGISDAKESASQLARRLAAKTSDQGILICLGYRVRESARAELVFEVPSNLGKPQTLRDILVGDIGKGYGGGRPLDHRFRLARQISQAVLSVHTAQLVHKSIRPEAILIFQPKVAKSTQPAVDQAGLGVPFLTGWKMVRRDNDLSSRRGESDWMADIYRHPRRQGLHPEERYNMKHDIYSLGVCLLEIGLWEPFIVDKGETKFMNDIYCNMAVDSGKVKPEDSCKIASLTWPKVVQDVMLALAKDTLPQRMGFAYTDLTVYCLSCLDGAPKEETDVGVKFNDMISQSFWNMQT